MTHSGLVKGPSQRSRDRAYISGGMGLVALLVSLFAFANNEVAVGCALLLVAAIGGLMAHSFVDDMRRPLAAASQPKPAVTGDAKNAVLALLKRTPAKIVIPEVMLEGWREDIDFVLAGPMLASVEVVAGGASGALKLNPDGTISTRTGLMHDGADIRRQATQQARKLSNATHVQAHAVVVVTDALTPPLTDWPGIVVCDEPSLPGVVRNLPVVAKASDPEGLGKLRRIICGEVAPLPDWSGTHR